MIRPTRDCGVKRFTGTEEQLDDLYKLGYQDMEARKEDIYKFMGLSIDEKN